ncbi:hypothetical protein [Yoonia sp.]|uniref:hypothetical protein n=1 Tax=Yoonia sp. TaxID=2212373 RepID=UPI0040475B68
MRQHKGRLRPGQAVGHIDQPQAVQTAPGRRVACWLYPPQDGTGTNAERQTAQ